MSSDCFVPLPGSERTALPSAADAGPVDGAQRIEITLIIRRRAALPRDLVEPHCPGIWSRGRPR